MFAFSLPCSPAPWRARGTSGCRTGWPWRPPAASGCRTSSLTLPSSPPGSLRRRNSGRGQGAGRGWGAFLKPRSFGPRPRGGHFVHNPLRNFSAHPPLPPGDNVGARICFVPLNIVLGGARGGAGFLRTQLLRGWGHAFLLGRCLFFPLHFSFFPSFLLLALPFLRFLYLCASFPAFPSLRFCASFLRFPHSFFPSSAPFLSCATPVPAGGVGGGGRRGGKARLRREGAPSLAGRPPPPAPAL